MSLLPNTPVQRPNPWPESQLEKFIKFSVKLMSFLLLIFMVVYCGLNYSGFCFKQMRYLSDEEKLKIAIVKISDINRKKPRCWSVHGDSVKSINRNYDECAVPYSSIDEFLQTNPDCCKLLKPGDSFHDYGKPPPDLWDRIFGIYNYAVKVKYVQNRFETPFKDKSNENVVSKYTFPIRGLVYFNNCGEEC